MKKNSTERTKKWCKNNREKIRNYVRKRREERRMWFDEILSKLSCKSCGENHPATLDFHHRDPKEKEATVSSLLANLKSKDSILKEIEKCDVLCANCHRKHHHSERNMRV